ncbi:Beta-galactosidase C-terminal domain [Weissella confusa]|nr:Beta-galactosidase C-terminal domain [Weissella confusa]MCT0024084.1 hypothetical protein [Weissella confusa]
MTNYSDNKQIALFKDSYTEMLSGNSLNGRTTLEPYQVIVAIKD